MWAEFYVAGYGWVPVDPSSGENDPLNHFAVSDSRYLPILKGQAMDVPYRSLFTLRSDQLAALNFNAALLVRPLTDLPFRDQKIVSIFGANQQVNDMRITAESAYAYGFNVTASYAIMNEAYAGLWNATALADSGDVTGCIDQAAAVQQEAKTALGIISDSVMVEARSSVDRAWREMRTLGALSAERYLDKAESERSSEDYESMVIDASYARTAADKSVNVTLFLGLMIFSGFTVWAIARNSRPKG
jgi:hypothetical protein